MEDAASSLASSSGMVFSRQRADIVILTLPHGLQNTREGRNLQTVRILCPTISDGTGMPPCRALNPSRALGSRRIQVRRKGGSTWRVHKVKQHLALRVGSLAQLGHVELVATVHSQQQGTLLNRRW